MLLFYVVTNPGTPEEGTASYETLSAALEAAERKDGAVAVEQVRFDDGVPTSIEEVWSRES
jgi:hypothetical protein